MAILKALFARYPRFEALLAPLYYRLYGECPVSSPGDIMGRLKVLVDRSEPVIVEAGCNDGEHTLAFIETFERPRVFCFEPDPRAIRRFKMNVGRRPNLRLFEMALSDHRGTVDFFPSGGAGDGKKVIPPFQEWDYSGSIRRPREHLTVYPSVTFDSTIKVETTTLDAWCDEQDIGVIDLLWMDVQGAEMDVFRGAVDSLRRTRYVFTEYSNRELYEGQLPLRRMLKYLREFEVVDRFPEDVLLRNRKLS